jgi:hypothetical protein
MSVDFPDPEAPINATISPRRSENETLLRIRLWRSNRFETPRTSTRVSDITSNLTEMADWS